MARAKKVKDTDGNSGKGDNLRVADSCDTCQFAGFKAAYHGGKRITGLCLRYQSEPRINYNYSPLYLNALLRNEHSRMRMTEDLGSFTFEQYLDTVTEDHRAIRVVYLSYMFQKGREAEVQHYRDYKGRYSYVHLDAQRIELRWVDNLPDDLTVDDWPYIVAEYLRRGGKLYSIGYSYGTEAIFDTNGKTREEILAPLRKEWELLKRYHLGWRDYFRNSPVTKIKRTTICDNYTKLEGKRPRINPTKLILD